jgi:tetratricopeptide (TPR) repeat protein
LTEGKLTKEELREDPVLNAVSQAGRFLRERATLLMIIGGVALAALVVAQLVRGGRARSEGEAAVALQDGEAQYTAGNPAEALNFFKTATERFGSTQSGKIAALRAADCQLELGNTPDAKLLYERAVSAGFKSGLLRASALRGLAAALGAQGQHEEAARRYLEAAEVDGNPLQGEDLLSAGTAFLDAGRAADARGAFQKMIESHPEHPRVREARDGLERAAALER